MKKLIFILLLFISFQSFGQNRFPSIDSAKAYTLRYYRNSTVETFTNYRGQNIAYGTLELLDSITSAMSSGGVDSVWISSSATKDSIKYSKSGTTYTAGTLDKASLRLLITDTSSMLAPYATNVELNGKVDSVTFSNDSAFYHTNGTTYYIGNIAAAAAGGDTTVFEIVLDSTGQQNTRVLYAKNNKIASDDRFFYDETNNKLVINAPNISVGGPNTKLFVSGNSTITGTATVGALSIGSLTGILKGASGTVSAAVAGTDYQAPITLTTTGSSGASTLIGDVLNIPQYSGGGGASDSIQNHTSGATVTVSNGVNVIYINPSSTLATLTITLPATPHASNVIEIYFGGTMTSGNVVTAITISPNTGQTLLQATTPSTVEAGESISYRYNSSLSKWYRK